MRQPYRRPVRRPSRIVASRARSWLGNLGLRWKDVTCYIKEYALGRKLTKAELKRFVEKNLFTIERKGRKRR
jgi:hypothetical protein